MPDIVSIVREKEKKPENNRWPYFFYLILALGFCLDRLSKELILTLLGEGSSWRLGRFFSLTCLKNSGICFGWFRGGSAWWPVVLGSVFIFGLIWWYAHSYDIRISLQMALGLIGAGVSGNLYDRIQYRAVVDFLDFHFWPVFNLADTFLVTGVFLLLFLRFQKDKLGTRNSN